MSTMNDTVKAIQGRLQTDITYVRNKDIFITPDDDYVPNEVAYPAIGIKDGPIRKTELMNDQMGYERIVRINLWVDLAKGQASIIGDSAGSGRKGILDMADDVNASLDENTLSLADVISARCENPEPEAELFGEANGTRLLVRKKLTIVYESEGDRP
jgi:hypothetical protein